MATGFNDLTLQFLAWFTSLPGATFSDDIEIVDLRERNAGRGIIAKRDIAPETVLFTIPRKSIISTETSELRQKIPGVFGGNGEDAEMEDGGDETAEMDSWSALILVMVYEFLRGGVSPWKPYFDVLPVAFETPMFWSDEELKELQASATVSKVGKADAETMFRETLLVVIRNNAIVFEGSDKYTDEDLVALLHRMGSTIMSYAFDLENDEERDEEDEDDGWVEDREGKSLMGMVAMADILNADAEFNAHVNHEEDCLTVTALRAIKAGEEILNYYGPHPNSELLRRYGYVTSRHGRYDVVEIPWTVVQDALVSQLGISAEVLEQVRNKIDEDELEDTFVLERESSEPNSDGTFAGAARITEMPPDLQQQLKVFLKAIAKAVPEGLPDKRKRDEVQGAVLSKTMANLEAQYPTTAEEDERLLSHGEVTGRRRMAAEVRLGEKRLLREALEFLRYGDEEDVDGPQKRAKVSS